MTQERSSFYRPDLDIVRFFAFLAVFFHHTLSVPLRLAPWHAALIASLSAGLPLFFLLSAYLITLLLLREKNVSGSIHLRPFYLRRMLRIWPLYFAALAVGVGMEIYAHHLHVNGPWFLAAALLCGNWIHLPPTIVGHLWSISVEEQFYVFWPTVMRRTKRTAMVSIAILLILAAFVVLAVYGHRHVIMNIDRWDNSALGFAMFGAGILMALFEDHRPRFGPAQSFGLFTFACALWYASSYWFGIKLYPDAAGSALSLCFGYALVIAGCVLVLIAVPGIPRWPRSFIYLGKISYGLYVFHVPMIALAGWVAPQLHGAWRASFILALTILLAAASYRFYESPFLRLKRKLEIIKTRPV